MATCAPIKLSRPRLAAAVFTGVPERDLSATLTENSSRAVESLKSEIESIIAPLVLANSQYSFRSLLQERIQSYCELVFAVSSIVMSRTDQNTIDELAVLGFKSLTEMFENARPILGTDVTESVTFSVYTMQRTFRVLKSLSIERLMAVEGAEGRCVGVGAGNMVLTLILLDCLRLSLQRSWRMVPAVLEFVGSSMRRCSMDAYAAARQLQLNSEPELSLSPTLVWDDEDRELAEESYIDLRFAGV